MAEKITGDEPFYPCTNIYAAKGITIRQEVILRFMVKNSPSWSDTRADFCADQAKIFADAYIKALNNE